MIANKEFLARCRGCKKEYALYNYKGLHPDSLMGSHYCNEIREFMLRHPKAWKYFDKIREVPVGTTP